MAESRGYPDSLLKSIEAVGATREKRAKEAFRKLSLEERDVLLKGSHPDYRPEGKRNLKIGPSKGAPVPHEVADLLEATPVVEGGQVNLSKVDFDTSILIIGGGGAGTVAALWANKAGVPASEILIATKLRHGDSNSMMAQGGIQAADKENDSPPIHYLDAIGGGHFTNKPELVSALVGDGPAIIKWHEELGVMYDKDDKGTMMTIHGGGTSRKRMHSSKDYTGAEIMRVLRDESRNIGIPVLEFASAVSLLTNGRKVTGALLWNMETNQYYVARAKATIIATGGFGRLHIQNFPTTNHYGATMDGLVMAYQAGAKLRDMDSTQYHPTGVAYPEPIVGLLVTEKVRGLGAQPVNSEGNQFVHPLEPRDVEAAAFIRECYSVGKGIETPTGMKGVWLDSPLIEVLHGEGTVKRELSAMHRMFANFGIDMARDPILVFPTLHYQNGGIEIEPDGRALDAADSPIEGLFVAGEASGGVHGKNRLMGNSLLDYNVFGRRAGLAAASHVQSARKSGKLTLDHLTHFKKLLADGGLKPTRKAPMLLPDYRGREALSRSIDIL